MASLSVGDLLGETAQLLGRLADSYHERGRVIEPSDPVNSQLAVELATLLARREQQTIEQIERYRLDDGDPNALGTMVRLSDGFPFDDADVQIPDRPSLDELLAVAKRTDDLLETLIERVRLYAAPGSLLEALEAFDSLVAARRRELAAALRELEDYRPSGPSGA